MKTTIYFLIIILLSSCAKLPIESITLTEAIIDEGNRMHELNILLVNKMFKSKSEEIDRSVDVIHVKQKKKCNKFSGFFNLNTHRNIWIIRNKNLFIPGFFFFRINKKGMASIQSSDIRQISPLPCYFCIFSSECS